MNNSAHKPAFVVTNKMSGAVGQSIEYKKSIFFYRAYPWKFNGYFFQQTLLLLTLLFLSCGEVSKQTEKNDKDSLVSCEGNLPSRIAMATNDTSSVVVTTASHEGMVWIEGGTFLMGASDNEGRPDEYPQHEVRLKGFWIDVTEVTNAQFKKFVDATGYMTTAEKVPDWEEMKKQLPAGTSKPPDDVLVAASLVFTPTPNAVPLNNAAQWWTWKKGADWRHPQGAGSSILGKENQPAYA